LGKFLLLDLIVYHRRKNERWWVGLQGFSVGPARQRAVVHTLWLLCVLERKEKSRHAPEKKGGNRRKEEKENKNKEKENWKNLQSWKFWGGKSEENTSKTVVKINSCRRKK
jgi:hypothetical protein